MIADRYSLEREIGRGGTGRVWLGHDQVLGRPVALKRIGVPPGTEGTDLARAQREARLSAMLNHPNVVGVFDVVTDHGTDDRWLVMEYVEGTTLARLVRERGGLPAGEVAGLLGQVADGLVAAHSAGVVHRDVKPSNILVEPDGRVKLTDFGIARTATDPALTSTGLVTGSPAYLAPEVASGARGDEAADVWSLGATIYHALAGRPPYDVGENVLGALYRIVHEEPPRLEDAGPLAPVLEHTMVRDPAGRWPMERVRDFLAGAGADRTTAAPPLPAPGSPQRRRPTGLLVGLGALLAVVLALAFYLGLSGGQHDSAASPPAPAPATTPASPTGSPTGAGSSRPAEPTARGMKSFIRDYVHTVARDPRRAWTMLTPRFQRASGGFATYRRFWDRATNGRVLSIDADPHDLTVSYQVHFDDFHNGPGPTVLVLRFDHGRYRIDAEHTAGFVPKDQPRDQ